MKNILVAMLNAMMVHLPLSAEDVNKSNTNMTNMTTNQGNPHASSVKTTIPP
jgi:hypothetical protein